MGSKTKQVAGVVAAPFTGGASLALTAKGLYDEKKEKKQEERRKALVEEEAQKQKADLETENKRLNKELDIATRPNKKSGLASLVGGESNAGTLG